MVNRELEKHRILSCAFFLFPTIIDLVVHCAVYEAIAIQKPMQETRVNRLDFVRLLPLLS